MTDANTYRHRKLMFFRWLKISLIGLIALTNFWALVAHTAGNSHGSGWRDPHLDRVRLASAQSTHQSEFVAELRLMFVFYHRCFKCNDRGSRTVRYCGIDLGGHYFRQRNDVREKCVS